MNSASPNKWSFPGGRLENPGDLDEDGDVGTRRELEEECGGGEPQGLPSLIHIECYKSGKVRSILCVSRVCVFVERERIDRERGEILMCLKCLSLRCVCLSLYVRDTYEVQIVLMSSMDKCL